MFNEPPSSETSHEHSRAARVFTRDGVRWVVKEVTAPKYDRRGSSLVFSSDEVMRRVRNFPERWQELDDDELYALSLRS